jgi:hypothetical protein
VGIDYCTSEEVGEGIFGIPFESHSGKCQSRSECGRGEDVVLRLSMENRKSGLAIQNDRDDGPVHSKFEMQDG